MDRFKDIKLATSPLSSNNSPNYSYETHRSIVLNRANNELPPTKLDFRSNADSKFTNINMIQSQVVNNSTRNPMADSTINYMRSIYRGIPGLSEDRLRYIAENFMKMYGTGREITVNGVRNIQKEANSQTNMEQSEESVKELFKVLDYNRDNRVTVEDVLSAAKRYLNFQKKQIIYTPMVEERLAVARRLFKQFDVDKKGFLTEKQVPHLLSQTYRCLNKSFQATEEDVRSWMKLTDGDGDGYVTLPEYQQSIIRALKKQGVKIYEE